MPDFSGGLLQGVQEVGGDFGTESSFEGGLEQSLQSVSGELNVAWAFSGGISQLAQSFSGAFRSITNVLGGLTQPIQRFNETRTVQTLDLVPQNAFGYDGEDATYLLLANKEHLLVTDLWWSQGPWWVGIPKVVSGYQALQVSDGVGGYIDLQVSDGAGGFETVFVSVLA